MAKLERVREFMTATPPAEYFQRKAEQGWKLVSIDWERDVEETASASEPIEEAPYGLEVADDCRHLKENSKEKSALMLIMEMIVKDEPLSEVAEQLNRRGYRTRDGLAWTPVQVFDLLPRLIEAGPRILTNGEYVARKQAQTGPH